MKFNWDSANVNHIARHGITPEEAEQVIQNDPLDAPAMLRNNEASTVHLGETNAGRVLVVVITERGSMYRVVTARPAKRKERVFIRTGRQEAMTKTLKTPDFKSEAEEAAWWDSHPDQTLAILEQAAKDGTLGRGTLARRTQTAATSIRLDTADIELAKNLAHQRGLRYQTYLKMIIHQHLLKETGSTSEKL